MNRSAPLELATDETSRGRSPPRAASPGWALGPWRWAGCPTDTPIRTVDSARHDPPTVRSRPADPACGAAGPPRLPSRPPSGLGRTSSRASGSSSARGSAASPTTWTSMRSHPVRGPARLAGRDRAGSRRPAAPRATSTACPWRCSRAGSTCTRATTPGLVVQPVLLMGRLGARVVVLTNAAGGVNPAYAAGHPDGHRRPPQPDGPDAAPRPQRRRRSGPRFPDLPNAWSPRLRGAPARGGPAPRASPLDEGIYAGLLGPAYETPAEVRMLRYAGRGRRRHVDGARGDRRALGRHRGLRRVARDEPGRRVHGASADARGGPARGGRGGSRGSPRSSAGSCASLPTGLTPGPARGARRQPDRSARRGRPVATGGACRLRLLRPGAEHRVLVRPDRAVLVAVAPLVAVAERHALRGEERAEERD